MPDETAQPVEGTRGAFDPIRRRENRQHLRVMEQVVYGAWDVPETAMNVLPKEVLAIATDSNASTRDRIRATELLAFLRQKNFENAEKIDRIYRLEDGTATERVEITADMPEGALEAVARSIAGVAPAEPPKPCRKPKRKP
jgi:hypothetical protein